MILGQPSVLHGDDCRGIGSLNLATHQLDGLARLHVLLGVEVGALPSQSKGNVGGSRQFGDLSGVSMTDGRPTAAIVGMELFRDKVRPQVAVL